MVRANKKNNKKQFVGVSRSVAHSATAARGKEFYIAPGRQCCVKFIHAALGQANSHVVLILLATTCLIHRDVMSKRDPLLHVYLRCYSH